MADDRGEVIHLLRRTGYTARPADVDRAVRAGYAATVDAIVAGLHAPTPAADAVAVPELAGFAPVPTDPTARKALQARRQAEGRAIIDWWMGRMVATEQPFAEKLTFFWHGHFATSIKKVHTASHMVEQNQLLRTSGPGPFEMRTQAIAKGPAMLIWLDANQNKRAHPNENFARELMELFTLGIGSYTEADVKDAARAFTGWSLNRQQSQFAQRAAQHDDGTKAVLGSTGALSGEDVIHLCCSNPATGRHVAARLWSRFAVPIGPADPIAADLAAAWGPGRDTAAMVRAMLLHPMFRAPATKTGLVKQPVEWVVGALRALGVAYSPPVATATARALQSLGQVPFDPPSVGGWPAQTAWLSTATQLTRLTYAQLLAGKADLTAISAAVPTTARTLDPGKGILVLLTLYGGNDGLNTVVPAHDAAYRGPRGPLALDESKVLPLGDGLSLHPSLTGVKHLWDAGQVAIVRGVGYPNPVLSHFRSMDIWQTAQPDQLGTAGWLGRWLDANPDHDPLLALSTTPTLPLLLQGARTAGAALLPGTGNVPFTGTDLAAYKHLTAPSGDDLAGRIHQTGTDTC